MYSKIKKYTDHTFDSFCKISCRACMFRKHDQHSTYTRKFCLPGVRKLINNTSIPDWSYSQLLRLLDEKNCTFKIVDKYVKIYGNCGSYVAKHILCSSPIKAVQIYYKGRVRVYCANTISTSFSLVSDIRSIDTAIANCKVRECKKYPEF